MLHAYCKAGVLLQLAVSGVCCSKSRGRYWWFVWNWLNRFPRLLSTQYGCKPSTGHWTPARGPQRHNQRY